jgi:hypothetical protein
MKRILTILGVAILAASMCVPATAKGPKGPKGPKGNNGNHYGWYKSGPWKAYPYPWGYETDDRPIYSYSPYSYPYGSPWGGYYVPYGYNTGYRPNYSWYGGWGDWYDD